MLFDHAKFQIPKSFCVEDLTMGSGDTFQVLGTKLWALKTKRKQCKVVCGDLDGHKNRILKMKSSLNSKKIF